VNWVVKLQEYVGGWLDAPDDVWDELQPHTKASYGAYLRWYLTRTRPYVTFSRIDDVEHQHLPTISDTYPLYRDQAQCGAVRLLQLQLLNFFYKKLITILLCFPLLMQIDVINCAEVETASQITLFECGVRVPDAQYKESSRRIHDNLTLALRALTCRSRDDVGASSSSHASTYVYTVGPSTSAALHAVSSGTAASSSCKSFIIAIFDQF
jgi:hypothetical protein